MMGVPPSVYRVNALKMFFNNFLKFYELVPWIKRKGAYLAFLTAGIKPAVKEGTFSQPSDTIWHVFLQKFRMKHGRNEA